MKTLILVRHAKSDWSHPSQTDVERTLKKRGQREAGEMASLLSLKGFHPDIFISSVATRTVETAGYFLKEFGKDEKELKLISDLYRPHVYSFSRAIESIENSFQCAILFSHNPGITEFINDLGCRPVTEMPACGMYGLQLVTENWDELRVCEKKFLFYDFPKKTEE